MTEKEAINYYEKAMQIHKDEFGDDQKAVDLYNTTINALRELQQYRAIGTVEEIEGLNFSSNQLRLVNHVEEYKEKLKKYEAIGTIEECREARRKQMPMCLYTTEAPLIGEDIKIECRCPQCNVILGIGILDEPIIPKEIQNCFNCGQKLYRS